MPKSSSSHAKVWTRARIEAEKREVKAELDGVLASAGHRAKMERIFERILELADDASEIGRLRRFIYVISALHHHKAFGGLTETQLKRLAELGGAILRVKGIKPIKSGLAYMHGDLHLALSQVYRKFGRPWEAAWEQQLAWQLARRDPLGGPGHQSLAMGIRSLRLGYATLALASFEAAEQQPLSPGAAVQARLGRIQSLRLRGDLEAALALVDLSLQQGSYEEPDRAEMAWEGLCCRAMATGDLGMLVAAVARKGTHEHAAYMLEAQFWVKAGTKRAWDRALPLVRTLARNRHRRIRRIGFFFKCAETLEQCYDARVPFASRLQALGRILAMRSHLVSVDKELLVCAAAARWLARNRLSTMAALVTFECRALSLRLSDGASGDVLGLTRDLVERDWTKEREPVASLAATEAPAPDPQDDAA